jgi:hypothetical protein
MHSGTGAKCSLGWCMPLQQPLTPRFPDGPVLGSTVLMSCGWPLLNSVLNDYVPKSTRARWNSVKHPARSPDRTRDFLRGRTRTLCGGRSLPVGRGALRWA